MKTGCVLVVDDHKHVLDSVVQILEPRFAQVIGLPNPKRIPEILRNYPVDVVLLDMNFSAGMNNGNEGLFWLKEIKKTDESIQIIPISAYGEVDIAVKALKAGATDFIQKPWENEKLIATISTAYHLRQSRIKIRDLSDKQAHLISVLNQPDEPMIWESPVMRDLMEMVSKVAATDASLLVTGENGTGKGLLVRAIHNLSTRSAQPLVTVDLGSLTESLFESELFGHRRGAFTDAREDRTGRFVLASGGTLFLDEIGNIPIHLQSKLLSVIQEKRVSPIGSNQVIPVDVRLICATNLDVRQLIAEKLFREDLLFRINTIEIRIPPLRERKEDIPPLAGHFIRHYAAKYGKQGVRINQDAMDAMINYSWPGNIRELKHVVEKAVILCDRISIKSGDISLVPSTIPDSPDQPATLEEIEKGAILRALTKNSYKVREASAELGISRQTLYNKMNKYGI
jgi:two-component system, NtrC family, response regulator HydG